MSEKVGIHLLYESNDYNTCLVRVLSYCFDGMIWKKSHSKKAEIGKAFTLKCLCGANDWTENGRFISEFECNCCGQFVQISQGD